MDTPAGNEPEVVDADASTAPPPPPTAADPDGDAAPVEGFDIGEIEAHIDALIEERDRLREENTALRARQNSLSQECARLTDRSQKVRTQVETMIARFRAMKDA